MTTKEFFSMVQSKLFFKYALRKIFEIDEQYQKNFFQWCSQNYFLNMHLGKFLK